MNDPELCFYNLPLEEPWPRYKLTIHRHSNNVSTYFVKLWGPGTEYIIFDSTYQQSSFCSLERVQKYVEENIEHILKAIEHHKLFCSELDNLP